MTTTVTAKIQLRKGTAAQWTSANPTLLSGEVGFETDTHKLKLGDGTTAWTALAYHHDPDLAATYAALAHTHTGVYEPANANLQAHVSSTANPHSVTAVQAGADASGTAAGLIASHEAAADPHPGYLTPTEGNAAYAATGHNHSGVYDPAGTAASAVSAHAGGSSVHAIASVTGLQTALDGKSATSHDHAAVYAPIAKGVTNGDSHDHSGGDGGQIAYSGLSGLPTLGTAAATASTDYATAGHAHSGVYEPADATLLKQADVDNTPVDGVTTAPVSSNWAYDHAASTTAHGISSFGATLVDDADASTARSTLGLGTAATTASGDYATAGHTHAQLHDAVTIADSTSIDLTLSGQQISAAAIFGTTSGTVCQGNDSRLNGALSNVSITGATDIGADLADDDELPTYDLSATANKKSALSRFWTYIASKLSAYTGTLGASIVSISGNLSSAAWTTNGLRLKSIAGTLTDTSSSGTVATACTNKLGGNTIAASSATTFTDYGTLYLDAPAAGTNVNITNPYSLITTGNAKIGGFLTGTVKNYTETRYATTTSGNVTLNLANGNVQRFILDAARQFTLPASPGNIGQSFVLILECATYTPTWNSSPAIEWLTADGAAPTLVTTANFVNVLTFIWDDTDTRWLGFLAGRES